MPRYVRKWGPALLLLTAAMVLDDASAQNRIVVAPPPAAGQVLGGRGFGGRGFGGGGRGGLVLGLTGAFGAAMVGAYVAPRLLAPRNDSSPPPDQLPSRFVPVRGYRIAGPSPPHRHPRFASRIPPPHRFIVARLPPAIAPARHLTPPFFPAGPPQPAPSASPSFIVPVASERRYLPGEILVVTKGASPAALRRLEATLRLTPLAVARIDLLDGDLRRYRLGPGASLGATVGLLRTRAFVTAAEPNYLFELQDDAKAPATATEPQADTAKPAEPSAPVQYAVTALHLTEAHAIAEGHNVRVAVIDSGLDETNPEIHGMVVARFNAVGGAFVPHAHGTAMGGTIVAHQTLVGIAPEARLIAIRAFTGATGSANGTGFDILRGLDFAAANGARIVNMSFAGPEDQLLKQALAAARQRGIIAIAAAGNAGPFAKPLYPAAEPGVMAVTATDADGKAFALANRGSYIAFAAPGVAIVAPGLGDAVQITSGTSIATAETSGVAALLLERNPKASPDDILRLLSATARKLTIEPAAGGAGVIDAAAALAAEN